MPRILLAWIAALAVTSWVGIGLAEIDRFSAPIAVAAGAAAAVIVFLLQRGARDASGGTMRSARATRLEACAVPLAAAALLLTLYPTIDTTLLSQDASIHRASGIWLARTGSLAIPDATLDGLGPDEKRALLGTGSVSPRRFSLVRLPGGIVTPDLDESVSYPSFAHLLAVWIAIAHSFGGADGIALLGPLFAFTAWWAIGAIAFVDGGLLCAGAALALLVTWLPEHWFARFLMPEILTQALVWGGVAAARLAVLDTGEGAATPGDERSDRGVGRDALVAGVVAGAALGTAAFARLEQLWVFVPALLLVRAALPAGVRLLPRGALVPFVLACVHAAAHLIAIPTDYGNRIFKEGIGAFAKLVVLLNVLTRGNGYAIQAILEWGLPLALILGLAGWLAIGARIGRRHPGFLLRASAGAVALAWLVVLYGRGLPAHLATARSLVWYVPWATWIAVGIALARARLLSGLEISLGLLALDQVVSGRVSPEQIWASRRLVPVVLPWIALMAARATAAAWVEVPRLRVVARAAVAIAVVLGLIGLRPAAGRAVQDGGAELVAEVARAVPPGSLLLVAQPLDWTHLAAALWLGHDRTTLVLREHAEFPAAFRRFLELRGAAPLFFLTGEVAGASAAADPNATLDVLPEGWRDERVASFRARPALLEVTQDRPPERAEQRDLALSLYRLTPARSGEVAQRDESSAGATSRLP